MNNATDVARISDEEANAALAALDERDRRCLDRCARCELCRVSFGAQEGSAAWGYCLRLAMKKFLATDLRPSDVEFES